MPVPSNIPAFSVVTEFQTDEKVTVKIQGFSSDDESSYYHAMINCEVVRYICSDDACSFAGFEKFFDDSIPVVEGKLWSKGLSENQVEDLIIQLSDKFPNP